MPYIGLKAPIAYGELGVETDVSQALANPNSLLMAENCSIRYGKIEKEPGSQRWNQTAFPASVMALIDWWPDEVTQRIVVACSNGKVYRKQGAYYAHEEITTTQTDDPLTEENEATEDATLRVNNQTFFVQGGNEQLNSKRKLFILNGVNKVQVIEGDNVTRKRISNPAADWTGTNQPSGAVIYNGKLRAWGCPNNPHTIYSSSLTDHEDFTGTGGLYTVFPGEGESIVCCFVYKTRLFVVKKPFGLYYIDETTSPASVLKVSDSFGAASPHCAIQMLDDMLVGNSSGSITSLKAVFSLGQVEQGDILKTLKCISLMQENTNPSAISDRHAVYYEDKKQALFLYRSPAGTSPDRILIIDMHMGSPKVTMSTKDTANCLAMVRDTGKIPRPMYGGTDGYVYQMDHRDRNVGGSGYIGRFQTPHLDFGFMEPKLKEREKSFDFIGITASPSGNWNISCDVFCDGRFIQTVNFLQGNGTYLTQNFSLGSSALGRLTGKELVTRYVPVSCTGRRISARFYNSTVGENFSISLIEFWFRPAGTNNK